MYNSAYTNKGLRRTEERERLSRMLCSNSNIMILRLKKSLVPALFPLSFFWITTANLESLLLSLRSVFSLEFWLHLSTSVILSQFSQYWLKFPLSWFFYIALKICYIATNVSLLFCFFIFFHSFKYYSSN